MQVSSLSLKRTLKFFFLLALNNDFPSGLRNYPWNQASTPGRTIIRRITIIMTTGECVFIVLLHPCVSIHMLVFMPSNIPCFTRPSSQQWSSNSSAPGQQLLGIHELLVSISQLRFTQELKILSLYLTTDRRWHLLLLQ